jgi:hypothetical protein
MQRRRFDPTDARRVWALIPTRRCRRVAPADVRRGGRIYRMLQAKDSIVVCLAVSEIDSRPQG